jgi:hypothetical protein
VSLALPAAVLLLLVLPGFLAVQGFLGRIGRLSVDPVGQSGLTWTWIIALPIAAALHAVWCYGVSKCCSHHVDLEAALALLSGVTPDKSGWNEAKDAVVNNGARIFWYFFSIYAAAALAGVGVRRLIRRQRLDIALRFFRFATPWQYLLSGELHLIELLQEPQIRGLPFVVRRRAALAWNPPLVVVTASVKVGEKAYLYAGFLKEWGTDSKGEPNWIRLGAARRRELTDDKEVTAGEEESWDRFYLITGFGVVLWCKDITSLNIAYRFVSS